MYNFLNSYFREKQLDLIERKYNAKYVIDSSLKDKEGRWLDMYAAIFYTKEPHPEGSNYFALYYDENDRLMITNGISAIKNVIFSGLVFKDNSILHSRHVHDYVERRGCVVDGGREYFRYSPSKESKVIKFKFDEGKIIVLDESDIY